MAARPSVSETQGVPRVVIPNLITEPIWSLRPRSVEIELAGITVEIPALAAADWLEVLMVEQVDPEDLFPGLLSPEDAELIEDLLYEERLNVDQLDQLFFDILTTVAARPWWVTLRLIAVARASWAVLGPEMLRQADATRLSLSGWLDVLLVTIMSRIEPTSATMFTLQLEMPPSWEAAQVQEDLEMTPSEFMAMAN